MRAAFSAADAGACVARGLPAVEEALSSRAALEPDRGGEGRRADGGGLLSGVPGRPALAMAVAPDAATALPGDIEYFTGGHPVPTPGSLAAGRRALDVARATGPDDVLVVLLSGGASSLLEAPADGVSLADLQATTARLLRAGADIRALNAVRKHLSRVKGGRLASACQGRTVALIISDVVGDDLAVIASGPTVADPTTYGDALAVLDRFGGIGTVPGPGRRGAGRRRQRHQNGHAEGRVGRPRQDHDDHRRRRAGRDRWGQARSRGEGVRRATSTRRR